MASVLLFSVQVLYTVLRTGRGGLLDNFELSIVIVMPKRAHHTSLVVVDCRVVLSRWRRLHLVDGVPLYRRRS